MTDCDQDPILALMTKWCDLVKGDAYVEPKTLKIISAKRVGKDCACLVVRYGDDSETDTYLMSVVPKKLRPRRAFNPKMRPMLNVPLSITVGEFRSAGNHGSCDVNFEVLFNG